MAIGFVSGFTWPEEIRYCRRKRNGAESFAARFAAKEAAAKALGTGIQAGVGWRDIELSAWPSGRPSLVFHGRAAMIARQLGANRVRGFTHPHQNAGFRAGFTREWRIDGCQSRRPASIGRARRTCVHVCLISTGFVQNRLFKPPGSSAMLDIFASGISVACRPNSPDFWQEKLCQISTRSGGRN